MRTMTKEHHWVMHTITPVSVLQDTSGEEVVFVDPDQKQIAEDDAVYGCDRCGVVMTGNVGSACEEGDNPYVQED